MTSAARRRTPLAVGLSMSSSTDKTPRKEGNDKTPRKEGIDQDASILESIKGTPSGAKPPKDWLEPMTAQELAKSRGSLPVIFEDVSKAAYYIRGSVRRTPCEQSPGLSELTGCEIYVKEEYKQFTGSFKERGARNALMQLPEEQKAKGAIAASAGNHALALSYHVGQLGVPVTVIMPTTAPLVKVNKCRKLGANVVLHGSHIGEAKEHAMTSSEYSELQYINGYDDPAIIAGAGTVGLEIVEQVMSEAVLR